MQPIEIISRALKDIGALASINLAVQYVDVIICTKD